MAFLRWPSRASAFKILAETEVTGPSFPVWNPTTRQLLIMFTLAMISFMVALDACVIVTSLNAIIADVNATTTQGFWIGTSYLLANAVTMPFIAEISNSFGRRSVLIGCLLSFLLGSILCCLARNVALLLVGRSFQGLGGGGIIVLSLVIFTDIIPLRHRPRWYGTVLGAWALGNCIGPVVGGVIGQKTTWRWVFYIMLPFCVLGLALVFSLLILSPPPGGLKERLNKVDWLGVASFIASTAIFLVAVSWGGTQFRWNSPRTLVPLCLGLAGIIWTCVYEVRFARVPFLHHNLFRSASCMAVYACGAIQGLVIYGQLYYVPFYFLAVKSYTPIRTGLALLPVMLTLVPSSIVTGHLVTRSGNYQLPIWTGWALTTLGSGLTLLFDRHTHAIVWAFILIILGIGHGSVLNAQNFAAQAMSRPQEEPAAAAMYAFLRQFGMSLGVGIGGSIFQNVMRLELVKNGLPAEIAKESESFVTKLLSLPDDDSFKSQILGAYTSGFRGVYLFYVLISGLALCFSFAIRRSELNKGPSRVHELYERTTVHSC